MNKKFSTLVAALLASGGLFYAVDAMILPAGDGVAQTFVGVRTADNEATAEVVACNSSIAKGEFVAAWRIKTVESNHYYLEVKDAADWILCEGKIQKITGSTNAEFTKAIEITIADDNRLKSGDQFLVIDTETGAVSLGTTEAGNAYLFSDLTTRVTSGGIGSTGVSSLALATSVTTQAVGTNDVQWTAIQTGTVGKADGIGTATNKWKIVAGEGGNSLKKDDADVYLYSDGTHLTTMSVCPSNDNSRITTGGDGDGFAVLIEEQYKLPG